MCASKTGSEKKPTFGDWGVDLSLGDPRVGPGEDFFRHINGKWIDEFELPADKIVFGTLYALADQSQEQVQALIEGLIDGEVEHGTPQQKVRDFYLSYMDESLANTLGLTPIKPLLAQIRSLSTMDAILRFPGILVLMQKPQTS